MDFDYVIIGAGSAGSILANRLSESGRHRVLLLEAGPRDGYFQRMPLGYGLSYYNPRLNWMYWSEPEPALDGRTLYVPRGKVLGGSSSINAMVYIRGQPCDFDDWENAGAKGWGWRDVAPAYEALENVLNIESAEPRAHSLCADFIAAGESLGLAAQCRFQSRRSKRRWLLSGDDLARHAAIDGAGLPRSGTAAFEPAHRNRCVCDQDRIRGP